MDPTPLFALLTAAYFFGTSLFSGDYYDTRFMWFFLGLAVVSTARGRRGEPVPAPPATPVSRVPVPGRC